MDAYLKRYLAYDCYFSKLGTSIAKSGKVNLDVGAEAQRIIKLLQDTAFEELIEDIRNSPDKVITAKNIPQISNLEFGTIGILQLLKEHGDYGMTYIDIGKAYKGKGFNDTAYIKYGENHAKLANDLDLLYFVSQGQKYTYISEFGYALMGFPEEKQRELIAKQILTIPIIRYLVKKAATERVDICQVLEQFVSPATAVRRKHSVKKLINFMACYNDKIAYLLSRIE